MIALIHCGQTVGGIVLAVIMCGGFLTMCAFGESRKWGVISLVACLLIIGGTIALYSPAPVEDTIYNIRSANDNAALHGQWVLFSGTVDSSPAFWIYRENGAGYKLIQIPASSTTVFMDENAKPYMKVYHNECMNPIYELHIPDDSIVRTYLLESE